jgi:Yip1 domain
MGDIAIRVLSRQEDFWKEPASSDLQDLLRYSFFLGFFPFAGYLFFYTITGTIWSFWPFIQTTQDVGSGLVFAVLQWILFATFPAICALILETLSARSKSPISLNSCIMVMAYSFTPLCLCTLFVGIPYVDRIMTIMGFATFLYLLYYGFRLSFGYTIARSMFSTLLVLVLFAFLRQMFVFAIGV